MAVSPKKFWLINYSWKQVLAIFGHFIKFGWFVVIDIAYLDRLSWYKSISSIQDAGKGHWLCIITLIKLIDYSWKQILAIFLILTPHRDLKLHIMIVQNVS